MNSTESNALANDYLTRLSSALSPAPADLREEIVTGIREELDGLDATAAAARIAELGDPAFVAAEALDGLPGVSPAPADARPSTAYLVVSVAALIIGGYLLPVIGWIVGLVMIALGPVWTRREKRIAVLSSVGSVLLATALLVGLRGPDFGLVGLVLFVLVPLATNIAVGFHLGLRWGLRTD